MKNNEYNKINCLNVKKILEKMKLPCKIIDKNTIFILRGDSE